MKGTVIYAFVRLKIQTSDNEEKIKCQNEVSTPDLILTYCGTAHQNILSSL